MHEEWQTTENKVITHLRYHPDARLALKDIPGSVVWKLRFTHGPEVVGIAPSVDEAKAYADDFYEHLSVFVAERMG